MQPCMFEVTGGEYKNVFDAQASRPLYYYIHHVWPKLSSEFFLALACQKKIVGEVGLDA